MSKPELSNSRIKLLESVGPTSHVKASCWLNIQDADLAARFDAYLRTAGDRGRPNVQLELIAGYFLFHEDSERVAKRVRRLLDAGRITPTMVGKRKWISRPEIEKFLTREEMPDDDDGA